MFHPDSRRECWGTLATLCRSVAFSWEGDSSCCPVSDTLRHRLASSKILWPTCCAGCAYLDLSVHAIRMLLAAIKICLQWVIQQVFCLCGTWRSHFLSRTAYLKGSLFYLQRLASILIQLVSPIYFHEQRTREFIVTHVLNDHYSWFLLRRLLLCV